MRKQRITRNELVEHIRQTMPKGYNEYEKIAFIELEVAKHISFDEKYLWGDIGTKEKIYKLAKKEAITPPRTVKRKLICVTMAELFGYTAKQFGFDVKYQKRATSYGISAGDEEIFRTISGKRKEHVCTLVKFSNGEYAEIDIQDDLLSLQTGSRPQAFGGDKHGSKMSNGVVIETLDKKLVRDTFRKVYNLGKFEKFTDEYIIDLTIKLRNNGKTPIEMLEIIMEDPRIKKQVQNTRCMEANRLYKIILRACYNIREGKEFIRRDSQAIVEECILSDDEGRKRYSFCVYAEDNEQKVFFVYSKKSRRMVKLTQEEIQQMMQQSKNIELRGYESSVRRKMISFIKNTDKNEVDLGNSEENIMLEDIFLDEDEQELQ